MTRDINNNNNNNNINICKAHIVSIRAESEAQYGISAHLYMFVCPTLVKMVAHGQTFFSICMVRHLFGLYKPKRRYGFQTVRLSTVGVRVQG